MKLPRKQAAFLMNRSMPTNVIMFGGHQWTFSQTIADVDPSSWDGILLNQI